MVDSAVCPRCSSPVLSGETYCAHCGAPLSGGTDGEVPAGASGAGEATARESKPKRSKVRRAKPDPHADADATPGAEEAAPTWTSTEVAGQRAAAPAAPPAGPGGATTSDPRRAALGSEMNIPASAGPFGEPRPNDSVVASVQTTANWQVDLRSMAQPPAVPRPPDPEPAGDGADHIPGAYLPPSATYRGSGWKPPERGRSGQGEPSTRPGMSVSVGAVPVSPAVFGSQLEALQEAPGPAPAMIAPPVPVFVAMPTPQPHVAPAGQGPAAPAAQAPAAPAGQAPAAPAAPLSSRRESAKELVAFGLVASGAVVGLASLFLPWAGSSGIGVGTVAAAGSPPQPNQWAWGMPAAVPLFLLTAVVLGAAAGGARAQQQFPEVARFIGRVTDVILPMLLGGLYFGVGLLYATLPPQFGYGTGILVLFVGACLLITGSIVALFFPTADDSVSA